MTKALLEDQLKFSKTSLDPKFLNFSKRVQTEQYTNVLETITWGGLLRRTIRHVLPIENDLYVIEKDGW
jgi:hypothetical protein